MVPPQKKKHVLKLERIQTTATKMVPDLGYLTCEERNTSNNTKREET